MYLVHNMRPYMTYLPMKLSRAAEELTLIYGRNFRDILAFNELNLVLDGVKRICSLRIYLNVIFIN